MSIQENKSTIITVVRLGNFFFRSLIETINQFVSWSLGLNRYSWSLGSSFESLRNASIMQMPREITLFLFRIVRLAYRVLRLSLGPDLFYRQLWLIGILQVYHWVYQYFRSINLKRRRLLSSKNKKLADLSRQLDNASSYKEWSGIASKIDTLQGKDNWKKDEISDCYDEKKVKEIINIYESYMKSGDNDGLIFHLRANLLRNNFGVTNSHLFENCLDGTKVLVEKYMITVSKAIKNVCSSAQMLANVGDKGLEVAELTIASLNETRHAYGRSALCLSGGAVRGVVKALHEENLLPRVITGSSAGSLIAAKLAVMKDEDLADLWDPEKLVLKFFSDVDNEILDADDNQTVFARLIQTIVPLLPESIRFPIIYARKAILRSSKTGAFLDVTTLKDCIRVNVGDYTFQEAYDLTGRIVNINIASTDNGKPRLLNYLTAPNVVIWSAAMASCAIPGVFDSVQLLAKDKNGDIIELYHDMKWSDGSFEDDLPMQRLAELFNVNQFIVSQVNPHAPLFSGNLEGNGLIAQLLAFLKQSAKNYIGNLGHNLGLEPYLVAPFLGWRLVPLITQKVEGDRTIVPGNHWRDLKRLLVNPTPITFPEYVLDGQKAAWPHFTWLKTALMIEITLDDCIKQLRQTLRGARIKSVESSSSMARIQSFLPTRSRLNLNDLEVSAPGLPKSPSTSKEMKHLPPKK